MYIYACVYVLVHLRLYTCVCVCVCIFVHRLWVLVSVLQSGRCHACACVFVCICMRIHMCVGIYICAFFCSECYVHFTGVLGTSAWAGVYVTQVWIYTNVHICDTLAAGCAHMCICMKPAKMAAKIDFCRG